MAMGCLAALFGIGLNPSASRPAVSDDDFGMGEGEIHSGPGGYEGMGYSGGYAADYREHHGVPNLEFEELWAEPEEDEET